MNCGNLTTGKYRKNSCPRGGFSTLIPQTGHEHLIRHAYYLQTFKKMLNTRVSGNHLDQACNSKCTEKHHRFDPVLAITEWIIMDGAMLSAISKVGSAYFCICCIFHAYISCIFVCIFCAVHMNAYQCIGEILVGSVHIFEHLCIFCACLCIFKFACNGIFIFVHIFAYYAYLCI